jgi:hypothetical protein
MSEEFQKAVRDADLLNACVSGLGAAILMSYVAHVAKPGIIHVLLALVAVAAIVGAYLFVARSKVEAEWKATTIIVVGAVGIVGMRLLSVLY